MYLQPRNHVFEMHFADFAAIENGIHLGPLETLSSTPPAWLAWCRGWWQSISHIWSDWFQHWSVDFSIMWTWKLGSWHTACSISCRVLAYKLNLVHGHTTAVLSGVLLVHGFQPRTQWHMAHRKWAFLNMPCPESRDHRLDWAKTSQINFRLSGLLRSWHHIGQKTGSICFPMFSRCCTPDCNCNSWGPHTVPNIFVGFAVAAP